MLKTLSVRLVDWEMRSDRNIQKAMDEVRQRMDAGTLQQVGGNPLAAESVLRHAAATNIFNNPSSSAESKKQALDFLTGEGLAMSGIQQNFGSATPLNVQVDSATNKTGLTSDPTLPKVTPAAAPILPAVTPAKLIGPTKPAAIPASAPLPDPQSPVAPTLAKADALFAATNAQGLNQADASGTVARAGEIAKEAVKSIFTGQGNRATTNTQAAQDANRQGFDQGKNKDDY